MTSGPITKKVAGVDPLLGKVIDDRYRVKRQLGEGGIGRVYVAEQIRLAREVALKTLLTRYESMPVLQARFSREAHALATLTHPNIVSVTDHGLCDGMPYIVMELLQGEDLAELLARGNPLDPMRVMRMMRQMVRALAYAHEQELVHRDLKPHNVFVRVLGPRDDHVEVLDFGLARFMSDAWKAAPKLTAQGALIGTPAYMAPEQASGKDVDASADVYAAGCVIFEALTGRRVFEAPNPGDMIRAHMLKRPRTLSEADPGLEVHPALEALIQRTLEKSPRARPANGRALLEALDTLPPEPIRRIAPRPKALVPNHRSIAPTQTGGSSQEAVTSASPAARRGAAHPQHGTYGDPVTLPQRRWPMLVGGLFAAVLLMGLGAGAVYFIMGGRPEPSAHPPTEPETPTAQPSPTPPRPAARAPFAEELPEPLAGIYQDLERGQGSWQEQARQLSRYDGEHEGGDPRASLLLGRIYTEHDLFPLALSFFRVAYEADPSVRGDPTMQRSVLRIARIEAQNAGATALIDEAWGAAFVGTIAAYMGEVEMPDAERQRLVDLQRHLATLSAEPR